MGYSLTKPPLLIIILFNAELISEFPPFASVMTFLTGILANFRLCFQMVLNFIRVLGVLLVCNEVEAGGR